MRVIAATWPFVAVFCLTFASEWAWAKYNIASAARKPMPSAIWSTMIVAVGTLSVQVWIVNHWTLVSSLLASFIGTYYAVKQGDK